MISSGAVFQPELINLMRSVFGDASGSEAHLGDAGGDSHAHSGRAAKGERNPAALKKSALSSVRTIHMISRRRDALYSEFPTSRSLGGRGLY